MQKSLGICLVCMMLMFSMVFVFSTLPIVSAEDSENTWFGYEHVGVSGDILTNVLQGSNFTCPSSGIADNMTVWLENWDSTANVSCAIYSSDGIALIGFTEEKNIGFVQGWVTFNFIGEPSLVADTEYLLIVWGDDGYIRYDVNNSHYMVGIHSIIQVIFQIVLQIGQFTE